MNIAKGSIKVKSYFLFLAFMLMITTYLPIFVNNSRFGIGNHSYWSIIWFISLLVFVPRTYTNRSFLYVFFYLIVLVFLLFNTLWAGVDDWSKREARLEVLSFLVPLSLYSYFDISKDYSGLANLIKFTLIFIAITSLLSIYTTTIDPLYARLSAGYSETESSAIKKLGGGGYSFASSLVFVFPIIIFYIRNNSKIPFSKPILFLFGIIFFIALIKMQIVANILVAIFAILFSFAGTKKMRTSAIMAGTILLVLLLIPNTFYGSILKNVSYKFKPDSEVSRKFNDLAIFIELGEVNDETGAGGRAERYPLLWEGFKANPILGFFHSKSKLDIAPGGHLYWMHKLTIFGILGFIPFILIFYRHIKVVIKNLNPEFSYYFSVSIFSGLGLGLVKSLYGIEYWYMFFFVIPSLYYLPQLSTKKTYVIFSSRFS